MEEVKAVVTIKGQEYNLKATIGFWKKVKEQCGVTSENMLAKIKDDEGSIIPWLVMWMAYYGMENKPESIEKMPFTVKDIEEEISRSVLSAIEQAVIDGMTKEEKRILDLVKLKRDDKFKDLGENTTGKKE